MTYQNYITENNLYVYGSKKIEIPEPEFYVIFTGHRKFKKDTISLKDDFWNNPDAKVDVTAKVIYAENKEDIIGQYIIFSHVLDDQVKKYGRNKTAVEATIRICKSEGVLREYLESREKEVIDIMITLFGQEYAVEAYAEDKARTREYKNTVELCQEFGVSIEEAIQKLISKFGLSKKDSTEYVQSHKVLQVTGVQNCILKVFSRLSRDQLTSKPEAEASMNEANCDAAKKGYKIPDYSHIGFIAKKYIINL